MPLQTQNIVVRITLYRNNKNEGIHAIFDINPMPTTHLSLHTTSNWSYNRILRQHLRLVACASGKATPLEILMPGMMATRTDGTVTKVQHFSLFWNV